MLANTLSLLRTSEYLLEIQDKVFVDILIYLRSVEYRYQAETFESDMDDTDGYHDQLTGYLLGEILTYLQTSYSELTERHRNLLEWISLYITDHVPDHLFIVPMNIGYDDGNLYIIFEETPPC